MSKKKSKKKRAAQKKQRQQQVSPVESKVTEPVEPDETADVAPEGTTPEALVADITEESEEAVPHHPISQRKIAIALLLVIGVLLLVIGYLVMSYNSTKSTEQLKSQDVLLQVKASNENSLQPSAGTDATNPQSTSEPGQNSSSAQDLQPQSSPTQQELNQQDQ
jgi:hypothetical protein